MSPFISEKKLKEITSVLEDYQSKLKAQAWHRRHPGHGGVALPGGLEGGGEDDDQLSAGFAYWMRSVANGAVVDQTPDWMRDSFQRSLSEGSDGAGGYMVPQMFIAELVRIIEERALMRNLVRVVPMETNVSNLPSLTSGVTVYWPGESQLITESDPVFGPVQLVAKKMAVMTSCSSELSEDSPIAVGETLLTLFGEAIADEEDRCILSGNNDPFYGLLYAASVNQVTMGTGLSNFSDVTFQDVLEMISALTTAASRGAMFFMHRSVLATVQKIRDLNHNYIWSPPTASVPQTIWGYPVVLSDQMLAMNASAPSTNFVLFGNPKYVFLGDRKRISMEVSPHVAFKESKVFFRAIERIAVTVAIPAAFARLRTAA